METRSCRLRIGTMDKKIRAWLVIVRDQATNPIADNELAPEAIVTTTEILVVLTSCCSNSTNGREAMSAAQRFLIGHDVIHVTQQTFLLGRNVIKATQLTEMNRRRTQSVMIVMLSMSQEVHKQVRGSSRRDFPANHQQVLVKQWRSRQHDMVTRQSQETRCPRPNGWSVHVVLFGGLAISRTSCCDLTVRTFVCK